MFTCLFLRLPRVQRFFPLLIYNTGKRAGKPFFMGKNLFFLKSNTVWDGFRKVTLLGTISVQGVRAAFLLLNLFMRKAAFSRLIWL